VIVVDASVLAEALLAANNRGRVARSLLADQELVAPALIDAEVMSAARKRVALGHLQLSTAENALTVLKRLRLRRVVLDSLLERMWELRDNVTPYDAAYAALAEVLRVPLITADRRLTTAPGLRCEVRLLR
jgi:predicted nucleic acid-binding protein